MTMKILTLLFMLFCGTCADALASTTIAANDSAITYQGRWYSHTVGGTQTMTAINGGGKLRFKFTGTSLGLTILPSAVAGATQPDISWSLDGGIATRATATASMTLATGLASGTHTAVINVEGIYLTTVNTWAAPDGLNLQGIVLDTAASVQSWPTGLPRIFVYGDSITEGLNMLGGVATVANANGSKSWPNQLGALIGAEVHVTGYGGAAMASADSYRGIPAIDAAYPYIVNGVAASDPLFTAAVFLIGYNDFNNNSSTFTTHYQNFLDMFHTANPTAHIYLLNPVLPGQYNGYGAYTHAADVQGLASANASFCSYVDLAAAGVTYSSDNVHPNLAGHTAMANYLATVVSVAPAGASSTATMRASFR